MIGSCSCEGISPASSVCCVCVVLRSEFSAVLEVLSLVRDLRSFVRVSGERYCCVLTAMLSSWLVVFVWLMAGAPGSNPADVEEVLDRYCVGCICEGASRNCDRQAGCEGGYCGPFRISQPYFQDVQGAPGIGSRSYEECTGEAGCAAAALRAYMGRYSRDCDGDGEVTCTDLAMIHRAGPGGCTNVNMIKQTTFFQRFEECRSNFNIN